MILSENKTPKYGFYNRLKAEFPSQIIVDVTENCNLACIHCPHSKFKKSEHYSGSSLDPEVHAKIIDEVRKYGQNITQYIRYTSNGEPLMLSHIYEMLEYAVKNSGIIISLTTNGTLLNETRAEKLLATGVDVIDISIDAFTPETYAKIRVNGDLNVTRANVLRLMKIKRESKSRSKIVVSYVEQSQNIRETKDFEDFWKSNGADYVVIRRLHSSAGAKTEFVGHVPEENESERYPCLYPWERITINPRGQLSFCPQDWVHGSVIADYRTTTIYETWQGEFYHKLREAHLTNDFTNHRFCGQCPDWKTTRWPDEGRSYADMIEDFKKMRDLGGCHDNRKIFKKE